MALETLWQLDPYPSSQGVETTAMTLPIAGN